TVPEVQHAMRPAEESGAEHRIGLARLDRSQQRGNLRRVVLEVGVLHHQHVALGEFDRLADRSTLALVVRLVEEPVDLPLGEQTVEDRRAAVGRPVVDTDDLVLHWDCPDHADQGLNGCRFVVHRDQYRHAQAHRGRLRLARLRAWTIAARMLDGSARPVPAMSSAVPWSGEVRTYGSPRVMFTPWPNEATLIAVIPISW